MPVYKNNTSIPIVEIFQDTNGSEIIFRIEPGKILTTTYILTDINLTEVNASPYYNPLQTAIQTVTSTGTGDDKTINLDLISKTVTILNQSDTIVTVFLRALANTPGLNCYPWTERIIAIGHNVNQLVIQFAAAGTVYVEERK